LIKQKADLPKISRVIMMSGAPCEDGTFCDTGRADATVYGMSQVRLWYVPGQIVLLSSLWLSDGLATGKQACTIRYRFVCFSRSVFMFQMHLSAVWTATGAAQTTVSLAEGNKVSIMPVRQTFHLTCMTMRASTCV